MVQRHGLPMVGLKKAAKTTGECIPYTIYVNIQYDLKSGQIYVDEFVNRNSWMSRDDDSIIHITQTDHKLTMQDIADRIARKVYELKCKSEE